MTDILHYISHLINGVFESRPPLNGHVIGMLNLLFNQGIEFIAVQNLCCCWWKCMIGLCKCHADVICSRQQPIWLSIKSFVLPSWFFIDCAAIVHHWLVLLRSAELRGTTGGVVDSSWCFHSIPAFPVVLTVCKLHLKENTRIFLIMRLIT